MIISHMQGLGDGDTGDSTVNIPFFGGNPVPPDVSIPGGGFNWNQLWSSLNLGIRSIASPILTSQFGGPKPGRTDALTALQVCVDVSGNMTNHNAGGNLMYRFE